MTSGQREDGKEGREGPWFPSSRRSSRDRGAGGGRAVAGEPPGDGAYGCFLSTSTRTSHSDLDSLPDPALAWATLAPYVQHITWQEVRKRPRAKGDTMPHYPVLPLLMRMVTLRATSRQRTLGRPDLFGRAAPVKILVQTGAR